MISIPYARTIMRVRAHYVLSAFITFACIVCFCLPFKVGIPALSPSDFGQSAVLGAFSPVPAPSSSDFGQSAVLGAFLFSFFHANIFHLIVNLWALWRFRPHLHTCLVAYASAVLTALIPGMGLSGEPTYGLSAFLFAAYAHAYSYYKSSILRLVAIQLAVALIPHINWKAHLSAFLMSYLYWRIYHGIKNK